MLATSAGAERCPWVDIGVAETYALTANLPVTCGLGSGLRSLTGGQWRFREVPHRIIRIWSAMKTMGYRTRNGQTTTCDLSERPATVVYGIAHRKPLVQGVCSTYEDKMSPPDLLVDCMSRLGNVVVGHQAHHGQSVVPRSPVDIRCGRRRLDSRFVAKVG